MADTPVNNNNNNNNSSAPVILDEDDMWTDELMEKCAQQMEEQLSSQSSSQPDTAVVGVKRAATVVLPQPAAKKMRSDHIKIEPAATNTTTPAAFVVPPNTQKQYGSTYTASVLQQTSTGQQYTNYSKAPSISSTPTTRPTPPTRVAQSPVTGVAYNKPHVPTSNNVSTTGPTLTTSATYDADTNSVSDAEDNLLSKLTDGIPLEQLRKYQWPVQPAINTVAQVANLIFGYDGWSWAISSADFIKEPVKLDDGQWIIYAECTVRVTVRCGEHARGKKSTGLYRYGYALDGGKSHVVMHAMQCAKTAAMSKAVRNALGQFGPGFSKSLALIEQHLSPRTAGESSD